MNSIKGRKLGTAYELYGFLPRVKSGRNAAVCKACNRVLKNTAAIRLLKHRNSCPAAAAKKGLFTIPITKKLTRPKRSTDHTELQEEQENEQCQQKEIENDKSNFACTFKSEDISDEVLVPNAAYNYEDTMDATITAITNNYTDGRLNTLEDCTTADNTEISAEDILSSKMATIPTTGTKPIEHYPHTSNDAPEAVRIVNEARFRAELDDDDLLDIEKDLDVIQNLMPRTKETLQLQEELCMAETEYYHSKAQYFASLAENSKIKQTLMILKSRKLQLEIENLRHLT